MKGMEVDESYLPMAIKLTYNNINHQKNAVAATCLMVYLMPNDAATKRIKE